MTLNPNWEIIVPYIYTAVPSLDNSFHRPSILSIVNQLIDELGIPKETKISYPGDDKISSQTGSAMATSSSPVFPATEKVMIEVDETTNKENLTSNPQLQVGNRFIMRDEPLQVYMKAAYITKDVLITFKFRAADKVRAGRLRDDIEARMAMIREMFIHSITYSYQIPTIFLNRLKEIHRLRESQGGYDETFDKWMEDHCLPNLTLLTNTAGTASYYSFAETAVRIRGVFDFDTVPEKNEKEADMTPHIVQFTYRLSWQAPTGMAMGYPIMIHNQIIPKEFIVMDKIMNPEERRVITGSVSDVSLAFFENTDASMRLFPPPGIHLPIQDEWKPTSVPVSSLRLVSTLIKVNKDNLREVCRLDNLGAKYYLNDTIIEFLIQEAPYLNTPGQSVFHVGVYDDTLPMHASSFEVTDELEVIAKEDLSIRKIYRMRLSVFSDFTTITQEARDRLAANLPVLELVLKAISPNEIFPRTDYSGVPKSVMGELANKQHTERIGRQLKGITVPRTVMSLMIHARLKND